MQRSLPTSYPQLYAVKTLETYFRLVFIAYWNSYEVGRLRRASPAVLSLPISNPLQYTATTLKHIFRLVFVAYCNSQHRQQNPQT